MMTETPSASAAAIVTPPVPAIPELPLSPTSQWKIPAGKSWHEKAGRAKSPVWEYVLHSIAS